MSSIDERVVQMEFDNDQFEKGIKQSMRSLDEFKKSLKLEDATKNLSALEKTAGKISLDPLVDAAKAVTNRFSDMGVVAMVGIERLANAAIDAGHRIINDMITPMRTGFAEYETQINAVQTILANTKSKGTTLDQVNAALDELNTYADKTIYNFTQMTKNIGTFTAAGVDLNTSVAAIKGIANLAAVSGSNSEQASRAMYQLSQALASGTVKLQDWNSVVNAGMGGEVFKNALMETARVHGIAIDNMIKEEGSFRETLQKGWLSTDILLETLKKFTGDLGEAELRSIGYTDAQIAAILDLGDTANRAATEVKTFTQLFDTLAEAAQSGWTQSWEILIGDFEEAKKLLTDISDALSGIINKQASSRNALLEQVFGTKGKNPIDQSKWEAFSTGYDNAEAFKNKIVDVARSHGIAIDDMIASEGSFEESLKNGWLNSDIIKEAMGNTEASAEAQARSLEEYQRVVAEIWQGNWGNGEDRFNRLAEAGYDYAFVQELVNLAGQDGVFTWDELTEEQKNLISTLNTGNNEFQDLVDSMQDSDSAINGLLEGTEELSGREKLIAAFTHIWEILLKVLADIGKVWGIVFPDNRAEFLSGLIDKFYKWVMALEYSSEMGAKVRVVFNGIFSAIAVVVDVVKAVVQGIRNFLDTLPKGDSTVLDFFVKIGLFLGQFRQFLLREGAFNKITEGLTNFLVSVAGFISSLWNDIKNLFSGEGLNFEWLDSLKRWFGKIWDTIKKINFEPFNEFINNVKEFFKNRGFNFEWVGSVKENVSTAFSSIGESFSTWAEEHGLDTTGPLEFISSALSNFWNWLTTLDWGPFEGLRTNLSDFWTWLTTNVSNIGQTIFDGIQNAVNGIISWFKEQEKGEAQSPIETVKEKLTGFVTWFVELKDTVGAKIEEVKNKVFAGITGAVSYFIDWVTKKREQLGSLFDVTDKIQAFIEWFKTTGKTIKSKATSIKDTIFAGVAAAIDRFIEWKNTKSTELTGLLEQFNPIQAFVDWFTDLASKAGAQVTEVKDTIFGGISNAIELFIQWKDKKKKQLTDLLKNFHPIQNFLDWFNGLANTDNIAARITEIKDTVFGGIINAINVLADWKQDKTTFLAELLNDFHPIQNFLDWFNGLKDNAASTIEDVKDTVFGGIINAIDKLVAWKNTTETDIQNLIGTFNPIEDFINWFNDTVANIGGNVTSVKDTIFKGVTDAIDSLIEWYNLLVSSDAFAPLISVKDQLIEFINWFRGESSESSKSEEKMTIFDVITGHFTDFINWGSNLLSEFGFIEDIKTKITEFLNFIKDPFGTIESAITGGSGRTKGVAGVVGGKRGAFNQPAAKGLVTSMGGGEYNIGDTARYIKANVTGEDTELTYENTIFYKVQELFSRFIDWFNSPDRDFTPILTLKETFNEFVTTLTNFTWPEIDFEGMQTFFSGIGQGIGGFITGLTTAVGDFDIVGKAQSAWEELKTLFEPDEMGMSWIDDTKTAVVNSLGPLGEALGGFFDTVMEKLSPFIGDIQLRDVMSWLLSALWALVGLATAGGIGSIVGIADNIGEWFEGITGGNKMVLLYRLGIGLAGIAVAVKMFSEMGDAEVGLERTGKALAGLLITEGFQKLIDLAGGTPGSSGGLAGVGLALMGIAKAAQIFSQIKDEEMEKSVDAIGTFMSKLNELALSTAGYDFGLSAGPVELGFSKGAFNFSTGLGLVGAAAAVAIMGWTAVQLGEVESTQLEQGIETIKRFGEILKEMSLWAGFVGFNLGAGLGEMALAEAVAIMSGTAQSIHDSTFTDEDVYKLIGFCALLTIMAMVVGKVSAGNGEELELPDGTKKKITPITPGVGTAFTLLGISAAAMILAETAQKIHDANVEWDDIWKVAVLAGVIELMAILTGKTGNGKKEKSFHNEGKNITVTSLGEGVGNIGSVLKTLGLVAATKVLADVAKEIKDADIQWKHVGMVAAFAAMVGMFAALTGQGGSYTSYENDGVHRRSGTKWKEGATVGTALSTLGLVVAVQTMGEVAKELAKVEDQDALVKGVVAVGAFALIVGLMVSAMQLASSKTTVGKSLATDVTLISLMGSLGEVFPKIAQAALTMNDVEWDSVWKGLVLLGLGLGELVAAGTLASLGNVGVGILIVSAAITAIGLAIAANIEAVSHFIDTFRQLYLSLDPDAANGDGSIQGFHDFVLSFLDTLEDYAEQFGEKGFNIADGFVSGLWKGLMNKLTMIKMQIVQWLASVLVETGAVNLLPDEMQESVRYNASINLEEYAEALRLGWTESSAVGYKQYLEDMRYLESLKNNEPNPIVDDSTFEIPDPAEEGADKKARLWADLSNTMQLALKSLYGEDALTGEHADAFRAFNRVLQGLDLETLESYIEDTDSLGNYIDALAEEYGISSEELRNYYKLLLANSSLQSEYTEQVEETADAASSTSETVKGMADSMDQSAQQASQAGQDTTFNPGDYESREIQEYQPLDWEGMFSDHFDNAEAYIQQKKEEAEALISQGGTATTEALSGLEEEARNLISQAEGLYNWDSLSSMINLDENSQSLLWDYITNLLTPEDMDWSDTEAAVALGQKISDTVTAILTNPESVDWESLGISVDPTLLTEALGGNFELVVDELGKLSLVKQGTDATAGFVEGIQSGEADATKAGEDLGEGVVDGTSEGLDSNSPSKEMMKQGLYAVEGLRLGLLLGKFKLTETMKNVASGLVNQTRRAAEEMVKALHEYDNAWKEVGKNAIKGLVKGMLENNTEVIEAAKKVAKDTVEAAKKELGEHSPSRVFEEVGMYADMGLVNGLTKYSYLVADASNEVADESINNLRNTLSNMAAIINGEVDLNPTIRPVLDISQLRNSSANISSMFNRRSGYYAMQANGYFNATQALQNAQVDARNSDVVSAINDLNGRIDAQAEALSGLQVVMNTGALVGQLKRPLDRRLGEMAGYRERGI